MTSFAFRMAADLAPFLGTGAALALLGVLGALWLAEAADGESRSVRARSLAPVIMLATIVFAAAVVVRLAWIAHLPYRP